MDGLRHNLWRRDVDSVFISLFRSLWMDVPSVMGKRGQGLAICFSYFHSLDGAGMDTITSFYRFWLEPLGLFPGAESRGDQNRRYRRGIGQEVPAKTGKKM